MPNPPLQPEKDQTLEAINTLFELYPLDKTVGILANQMQILMKQIEKIKALNTEDEDDLSDIKAEINLLTSALFQMYIQLLSSIIDNYGYKLDSANRQILYKITAESTYVDIARYCTGSGTRTDENLSIAIALFKKINEQVMTFIYKIQKNTEAVPETQQNNLIYKIDTTRARTRFFSPASLSALAYAQIKQMTVVADPKHQVLLRMEEVHPLASILESLAVNDIVGKEDALVQLLDLVMPKYILLMKQLVAKEHYVIDPAEKNVQEYFKEEIKRQLKNTLVNSKKNQTPETPVTPATQVEPKLVEDKSKQAIRALFKLFPFEQTVNLVANQMPSLMNQIVKINLLLNKNNLDENDKAELIKEIQKVAIPLFQMYARLLKNLLLNKPYHINENNLFGEPPDLSKAVYPLDETNQMILAEMTSPMHDQDQDVLRYCIGQREDEKTSIAVELYQTINEKILLNSKHINKSSDVPPKTNLNNLIITVSPHHGTLASAEVTQMMIAANPELQIILRMNEKYPMSDIIKMLIKEFPDIKENIETLKNNPSNINNCFELLKTHVIKKYFDLAHGLIATEHYSLNLFDHQINVHLVKEIKATLMNMLGNPTELANCVNDEQSSKQKSSFFKF